MDNQTLLEKFRNHLTIALALTIGVAGIIEITAYLIFIYIGTSACSVYDPYLQYKVILPIAINVCIYLCVSVINRTPKISHNLKNEIIIYGASAVAMVTSIVHREFIVNTVSFIFPMLLSAMFNNRRLITNTFLFSIFSVTVTVLFSWIDHQMDIETTINYIVVYGILIVSYFACYISIKNSQLHLQVIEHQTQTNDQLRSIILLDPMTGLYNHRTFHIELKNAMDRYQQEHQNFCLAILDIDHFKHINDRYGHDCGDIVIHNLAEIIKDSCSMYDKAFRYGGEEFAILFTQQTLSDACNYLEHLLNQFSDTKYEFTEETITFSCGIAQYSGSMNKEDFFSAVDKQLYYAKNNGRNQISSAQGDTDHVSS